MRAHHIRGELEAADEEPRVERRRCAVRRRRLGRGLEYTVCVVVRAHGDETVRAEAEPGVGELLREPEMTEHSIGIAPLARPVWEALVEKRGIARECDVARDHRRQQRVHVAT